MTPQPAPEDSPARYDTTHDREAAQVLVDRVRASVAALRERGVTVAVLELGWRPYGVLQREEIRFVSYPYPDAPRLTMLLGLPIVLAGVPDRVALRSADGECYRLAAG